MGVYNGIQPMKKRFIIVLFSFFLSTVLFGATTLYLTVNYVKDGDTLRAKYHDLSVNIRLEHIDAPEKNQSYGAQSTRFLKSLTQGKKVVFNLNKRDRYGRLIGTLYVDNINVNKLMVENGFAWFYDAYSNDKAYKKLEKSAKKLRKGLWRAGEPIPPWEYRKQAKVKKKTTVDSKVKKKGKKKFKKKKRKKRKSKRVQQKNNQ